jgi:hypothetical protein
MAVGSTPPPDGIRDEHQRPHGPLRRHADPLPLVVLGVLLLAAMLGLAGHEATRGADASGVALEWHGPERIRNGEFFEMRVRVRSERPLEDLTLGVEASLWEDLTINSFIPGPSEEHSEDGEFRFVFGALPAGSEFLLKVDGQLNPDILGTNEGALTVYDGETRLVSLPISIEVLP